MRAFAGDGRRTMSKISKICLALMFSLSASVAMAQEDVVSNEDGTQLFEKVENLLKEKEPEWTLMRKSFSPEYKDNISYLWKLDEKEVHVWIRLLASAEDAARDFYNIARYVTGRTQDMKKFEIGDKCYLWEHERGNDILLRKNRMVVRMGGEYANAEDLTKFAQHLADESLH